MKTTQLGGLLASLGFGVLVNAAWEIKPESWGGSSPTWSNKPEPWSSAKSWVSVILHIQATDSQALIF